jgi:hypothetical protein
LSGKSWIPCFGGTEVTKEKQGRRILDATRLVGVVALLGFSACAMMLGIVTWTLSGIRSDREELDALQTGMTRLVTSLDTYQIRARDEITSFLDKKRVEPAGRGWVMELSTLIRSYKTKEKAFGPGFNQILDKLDEHLLAVEKTRDRCLRWNKDYSRVAEAYPVASQRVRTALNEMRTAIITAEGRIRLSRALQIRRYREAPKKEAYKLADQIIASLSQGGDISTGKTEIADLSLLCERLVAEDNIDNLADLKDNEFPSTLDRLRRVFGLLTDRGLLSEGLGNALLDDFEKALFGYSSSAASKGQAGEARGDGFFSLCEQRLALSLEWEKLGGQVLSLFDALNATRQQLVVAVEAQANETAAMAEKSLGHAWQTMLLVGLASMAIFLVLSVRIARTVKNQIVAVREANGNLKREISERTRVERALRRSEEALRSAKNDLEVRVEERTSDLKSANERLEMEVAERNRAEANLRRRGEELSEAFEAATRAQQAAENERDRSEKMLAQVTEAKRHLGRVGQGDAHGGSQAGGERAVGPPWQRAQVQRPGPCRCVPGRRRTTFLYVVAFLCASESGAGDAPFGLCLFFPWKNASFDLGQGNRACLPVFFKTIGKNEFPSCVTVPCGIGSPWY